MMLPHVGVSGGMPSPRKLKIASSKIAEPQMNVPWTISGASVLGKTCHQRILCVGVPTDIAALDVRFFSD